MRTLNLLVILCLFIGCEAKNQVDDMHEKTVQMSETTSEMKDMTYDLRALSAWMFNVMKQGDGSKLRDGAIRDMVASETMTRKTLMATKYYYAFEFQIWNMADLNGASPITVREKLKAEAVIEFVKTIAEFMPKKKKETALSKNEKMQNLYALAVTMHKKNNYQEELTDGTGVEGDLTMLSLVQENLLLAQKINNGEIDREDLEEYQKEVLREQENLEYILKLRYMYLPVVALSRISDITGGLLKKLKMLRKPWSPKFWETKNHKGLNREQIDYVEDIFHEAYKQKEFLSEIGIEAKLDRKIERILENMTFPVNRSRSGELDAKSESILEVEKTVGDLLN